MALYPTEKVSCHLYALFVNDAERIKMNCNCEVKPQTHSMAENLNRSLWPISALATEKLQIQFLQKTYGIDVKTSCQLVFLPNGC